VTGTERPVLTEAGGGMLVVTLNRPEARNAVDRATAEAVTAALDRLDNDDDLLVGVLTGAGPGFSAGMDLKALVRGESSFIGRRGFAGLTEAGCRKPIIAAIEGFALAGGLELALACDIIVAARGARLGLPEVKRGLYAAAGGLLRLPRRINAGDAAILALTGGDIDAEEGYRLGLVNRLTEPGEALAEARRIAEAIARNAPLAVIGTKRVLVESYAHPEPEFWEWQRAQEDLRAILTSKDAIEGATAFAEKRGPRWLGA
jgi:enoyl-CoA hydratase